MARVINYYVTRVQGEGYPTGSVSDNAFTFHFKLPFIGHYSAFTQKRTCHLTKQYCNNLDI